MTKQTPFLIPTILCGGAGTRLWPLSRDKYPKQLLPLAGRQTMLQDTIRRMIGFTHEKAEIVLTPMIVCNEDHRFLVAEQIKRMGCQDSSIILEPIGRNTAPALTVAALQATKNNQDPLLLVMPADHIVKDLVAFHQGIAAGIEPALTGAIVTFGIVPDRPETGYGYIQADTQIPIVDQIFPIIRFVEKPDCATAENYLAQGGYYWNSGMFLLRAKTWLTAMKQLQPTMLTSCIDAFGRGSQDLDFLRLDRGTFSACPADSIDYAVMEKLATLSDMSIRGMMVPLDAGWSDVGSWDAVWGIGKKDEHGNTVSGMFLQKIHGSPWYWPHLAWFPVWASPALSLLKPRTLFWSLKWTRYRMSKKLSLLSRSRHVRKGLLIGKYTVPGAGMIHWSKESVFR